MKRFVLFVLVCILALTACASQPEKPAGAVLKVSSGQVEKSYSAAELQALGKVQGSFKGVAYLGVTLSVLLKDAGIDPAKLSAVKAIASDGFTANYDPALFGADDTMVAYAHADGGALTEDEAPFAMVLPNQSGKLNPRKLTQILTVP